MGALGPLVKVASKRRRWTASVVAYTLAGITSASVVGGVIGAVGDALLPAGNHSLAILSVGAIGLAVIGTDAGLLGRRLLYPRRRQTSDRWAHRYQRTVAAVMWGFDLGSAFNVRMAFAGPWLVAAAAAASRSPALGAVLFVSLWFGRALPVWLSSGLLEHENDASSLSTRIANQFAAFRFIELAAVAILMMALLVYLTS